MLKLLVLPNLKLFYRFFKIFNWIILLRPISSSSIESSGALGYLLYLNCGILTYGKKLKIFLIKRGVEDKIWFIIVKKNWLNMATFHYYC